MKDRKNPGALLIVLAGVFWGSMGLFVRRLNAAGFTSFQTAFVRLSISAVVFSLILLAADRSGFRIAAKDIPLFLGLGICSVMSFTVCYFKAIELMTLSAAAILLYTSPIWVMLMSALFFKEKLTAVKLVSLVLAVGGCVLVSGIGGGGGLSPAGILLGLASGVCYALYSILGTVALRRYRPLTVTTYTFIFASLGCLFFCAPGELLRTVSASPQLSMLLLLPSTAVITAVIPYLCYTKGLQSTEAGRASILATVEPVVASVLGIVVYSERPGLSSAIGIILVLSAIVLLNLRTDSKPETEP